MRRIAIESSSRTTKLLHDGLHRHDPGLPRIDDRCRGPGAVRAVIIHRKRSAGKIVDAELSLPSSVDQVAGRDRDSLDRKLIGLLDDRNDEVCRQADCYADVHLVVDVDAGLARFRCGSKLCVHQRKRGERLDDRANEERQQRQLISRLALEAIFFSQAPFPNVGDVDFNHRPRVRRGVTAFDHAFGDDAPRLRERNERAWNRLRVRRRSRSSRDDRRRTLPEAALRETG